MHAAVALALLLSVGTAIAGCASESKEDFSELHSRLELKRSASERQISGRSTEQILNASEQVLRTLDPAHMKFSLSEHCLLASRRWGLVFVFNNVHAIDYWNVCVEERNAVTLVRVRARQLINSGPVPAYPSEEFVSDIPLTADGGLEAGEAELFFGRLEHELGLSGSWPTCRERLGRQRSMWSGTYPMICNGVGIRDTAPSGSS